MLATPSFLLLDGAQSSIDGCKDKYAELLPQAFLNAVLQRLRDLRKCSLKCATFEATSLSTVHATAQPVEEEEILPEPEKSEAASSFFSKSPIDPVVWWSW
jgi:hypothetical protein